MAALSNDDVTWTATFDGYSPQLSDRARAAEVQAMPTADLLAMLEAPEAFVVAHVLLTRRRRQPHSTFPDWNGLDLEIDADGAVRIDPGQRAALARLWQSR